MGLVMELVMWVVPAILLFVLGLLIYGMADSFWVSLIAVFLMLFSVGVGMYGIQTSFENEMKRVAEWGEEYENTVKKWEVLEIEVQDAIKEEGKTEDVELLSQNGKENYYNVRSGEEMYRVYYKDFKVIGIEQNDKFKYTGNEKMSGGTGSE